MKQLLTSLFLLLCISTSIYAQTSCTSTPTSSQHTIIIQNTSTLTLNGNPLPSGSHIIAMYNTGSGFTCAGATQWTGVNTALSAFGADSPGSGNGFAASEVFSYRVELPNGCYTDNVSVTYLSGGFFSEDSLFVDDGISGIATLTAFQGSMSSSLTNTDVTCYGGNNGSINLNVVGGNSPYTYTWNSNHTIEDPTNLTAGFYSYTVTDGCLSDSGNTTITEPTQITLNTTVTNALCFDNGSISTTVSGGTSGYSYTWSNGSTSPNLSNVQSGNYSVTVTDANNCQESSSPIAVTGITTPLSVVLSNSTNVTCHNGTNGAITLNVSGGTSGYTYAWSNNATTQNLTNIGAGSYTCTITDANNCTVTTNTITINQPTVLSVTESSTDATCNGATDGSANITVSGGISGYTYSWSNNATTQNLANIGAGGYTCTITDANNCTVTTNTITINEPMVLNIADTTIINSDGNGSIDITPSGGTSPYQYNWSNGATTEDLTGLSSGSYTLTLTDANNCQAIFVFDVLTNTHQIKSEDIIANVYPNPTSNIINIKLEKSINGTMQIYDLQGRLMREESISGLEKVVDITNFNKQIYILKIITNNKVSYFEIMKI